MGSIDRFPELTADWFQHQGASDPAGAASAWAAWLASPRQRSHAARVSKALELASGLSRGSITNYFNDRQNSLSSATIDRLNELCLALNETLPQGPSDSIRGPYNLAMFLDLQQPPNPRFHLEFLDSLLVAVERYDFTVSLHQLGSDMGDQAEHVGRVLRLAKPHGLVWFRITPGRSALDLLRRQYPNTPAVVVYGARHRYERPVLAHIVPAQGAIRQAVAEWARSLRATHGAGYVVVAHLAPEPESTELPGYDGVATSVRNERIRLIVEGIAAAGLRPIQYEVADYSASRALGVLQRHGDALGWVCLSDELAIAVRQILEYRTGPIDQHRILGFDNSALAREHGITSFSQHLPDFGEQLRKVFSGFFGQWRTSGAVAWPPFREIQIGVELTRALRATE